MTSAVDASAEAHPDARYAAFISYSHSDSVISKWLHGAVEGYRVPRALVGTRTERGVVPARVGRLFRDEEELAGAAELSPVLEDALQASAALIVICSRRAARSPWVAREIGFFKRHFPERPVMAVIADGVPGEPDVECFPEELKYLVRPSGELDRSTPQEPLAPDLQKADRGIVKLKLIAGLLGVPFDALMARERRRNRRRLTVAGLSAAAIMVALASSAAIAWLSRQTALHEAGVAAQAEKVAVVARKIADQRRAEAVQEAERARLSEARARKAEGEAVASATEATRQQHAAQQAATEAQGRQAETLATQALAALGRSDEAEAKTLAGQIEVLPSTVRSRPLVALALDRADTLPQQTLALNQDGRAVAFVPSDDGSIDIADQNCNLYRVDQASLQLQSNALPACPLLLLHEDKELVAYSGTGERWRLNGADVTTLPLWSGPGVTAASDVEGDAPVVAATGQGQLYSIEANQQATAREIKGLADNFQSNARYVAQIFVSPDGSRTLIRGGSGRMYAIDQTGKVANFRAVPDVRFRSCVNTISDDRILCRTSLDKLAFVDWAGAVTVVTNGPFDEVTVLIPAEGGAAIQREDGRVAFIPGHRNAGRKANSILALSAIELGTSDASLAAILRPEPNVMLLLFSDGRVIARDAHLSTPYFSTTIEGGVKEARLDRISRSVIVLTMDGKVQVLDLSAAWFNNWVEPASDATSAMTLTSASISSQPVVHDSFPPVPPAAVLPEQLLGADGASNLVVMRFRDGRTYLQLKQSNWLLPGRPDSVQILPGAHPGEALLFTDRDAWVIAYREGAPVAARHASVDGDVPFMALASSNADYMIIGRHGSTIIRGDRVFRFSDPWPFTSTPDRFVMDTQRGLVAVKDAAGRAQILHLASGREIARAFGCPEDRDMRIDAHGLVVAGLKGQYAHLRVGAL